MLDKLFEHCDSIVVIDVETTGLNPRRDEIIELGLLRAVQVGGALIPSEETSLLIRLSPGRKLDETITRITGITQEQLERGGVEKAEACKTLEGFLGGRPLIVAYNAAFDMGFIHSFLKRFGRESLLGKVRLLDALTVYRDRRDYPHKLENALAAYRVERLSAHRAAGDAAATFSLLCAMEKELDDLDRYIGILGYNPKYGVTDSHLKDVRYVPQPFDRRVKAYEK
jgi:DNA polymerase-3 subunit epsilon